MDGYGRCGVCNWSGSELEGPHSVHFHELLECGVPGARLAGGSKAMCVFLIRRWFSHCVQSWGFAFFLEFLKVLEPE